MKWIWVVAGGIMQVPIIKRIKELGYNTIVSDKNKDAPGMKLADNAIQIDTYDIGAHVDIAEGMDEKPVGVLTAGADVGPTVSAIAETIGLKAESLDVALRCRNKLQVRKSLNQIHPLFMEFNYNDTGLNSEWKRLCVRNNIEPYPFVIKPLNGSGSKGLSLVPDAWKIDGAARLAKQYSLKNERTFIAEEKLNLDIELAIDTFIHEGKLHIVNSSQRIFSEFGIEKFHINQYNPPKEVKSLIASAAKALGVTWGPFKADLGYDKRYGWIVMECATRLSGGFDHMKTALISTNKDIIGAMISLAVDNVLPNNIIENPLSNGAFACAYSPQFKPGKINGWIGLDNMTEDDVVVLNQHEIKSLSNCTERPIFFFGKGNSLDDAESDAVKKCKKVMPNYIHE